MYRLLLLLTFLPNVISANPGASKVTVTAFTTQHYPLQYSELANAVYFLDAVEHLEEKTGQLFGQHPDPTSAASQAKAWLTSDSGKQFQQQLQQAYIGVTEGWKMGVMKVPAIVFQIPSKEPVVIYGQPNLKAAIAFYEQHQE